MSFRKQADLWGALYPNLDRLFLALWYVPVGVLLHSTALLSGNPHAYSAFAQATHLPIYRQFFDFIVPLHEPLFALAAIGLEVTIGLLLLSRGRWVKVGLVLSSVFQVLLIPTSDQGIVNLMLAIIGLLMLRYDFGRSVLAEIRAALRAGQTTVSA